MRLSGWAVSSQTIVKINALLDFDFMGRITYGILRPDVGNAFPTIASARHSGLHFEVRLKKTLKGPHNITLLLLTQSGDVLSRTLPVFVEPPALKAATAGRLTTTMRGRPSWRSGFDALKPSEGNLHASWICEPRIDDHLRNQVSEAGELEPAINADLLLQLGLHKSSGPVTDPEAAYITAVRSCARCHCLVVTKSKLDEPQICRLLSAGRRFVSSVRPWLTLLSVWPPTICYRHKNLGLRREIGYAPLDADAAAGFAISVAAASMANQLVIAADPLGVAMMRKYDARIFATSPKVSLLAVNNSLSADDLFFFTEFVAMNFADFHTVIADEGLLREFNFDLEAPGNVFAPRMVVVKGQEPVAV